MDHVCIRIYANGSAKYTVRDDAGTESWLSFNREYRPGNTLVVDGEVLERGYLSGAELAAIVEFVLDKELPDTARFETSPEFDPELRRTVSRYPEDVVLVHDWLAMEFTDNLRRSLATGGPRP